MTKFDDLKRLYVESIDWTEDQEGVLAFRFPMRNREIPCGTQLTVRESQAALFLNEGQLADIFEPGRYVLNTRTLPELARLKEWDEHFASPFKSDVFFFSTREQIDQKWGTPTPLTVRDSELGPIRVRAHGVHSFKIENPKLFFEKLSGTSETYTVDHVDGHLRSLIVSALRTLLGNSPVPFIDLCANQEQLCEALIKWTAPKFKEYGLKLVRLTVLGISLPKEMQAVFDKAASMRLVGDVRKYFIFQAAESLTQPASGGKDALGGLGVGIGVGISLGKLLEETSGQKETKSDPPSATSTTTSLPSDKSDDTIATLSQLRELHRKGLLTQEEYETKAAALLKKRTG